MYSHGEEVELIINGQSLGRKPAGKEYRYTARFEAVYAPGTVTAVAYAGGREISRFELSTAEPR